ncbi:MAG: MFS transporter [Verrucomicrobia bacterium]|nr:MFS transporter [Verrucomicrobiota bacterium]
MVKKPSLLVIFLTVFIDLIGFGIVLPLLPRYSERFGAEGFTIGFIVASFSIMQLFCAPAWGRLSDRIGRRPVLLISNAGSTLSYAMFALAAAPALAPSAALVLLLASRIFAGACGANISVASAYIADITPREQRSKGMGLIGVAFGLGFILGPALGALSAQWFGLAGPGCVAAGLCAANFVLACVILVESRQPGANPSTPRPSLSQWRHTLRLPRVGLLIGLYFLATFCFACFETTLPLLLGSPGFHPDEINRPVALAQRLAEGSDPVSAHLRPRLTPDGLQTIGTVAEGRTRVLRHALYEELNRLLKSPALYDATAFGQVALREETQRLSAQPVLGDALRRRNRLLLEDAYPAELKRQAFYYDERHVGYIFAYCGLISALVQGGVIGRLVKRFGEVKLIYGSLVVVAGSMLLIPYADTAAWLLLALGLFSAGSGVNRAPTMGLISIYSPPEEQGGTLGVTQSAGTLARIFGPVFATSLYASSPHSPYVAGAVLGAGAAAWAWYALGRSRPPSGSDEPRPAQCLPDSNLTAGPRPPH